MYVPNPQKWMNYYHSVGQEIAMDMYKTKPEEFDSEVDPWGAQRVVLWNPLRILT